MERITILNVDDYEPGRFARTQLLRSFGFTVREAATGREALSVAAEEPPKLVILDVNLPDMSGLEVCHRLKSSATTATVPVLHMSATYIGPVHKALGLESGADAYLTEPVDPPVLLATVRALLRLKRAEEAQRASAAEWQVTFDAISDGVALLDTEGVIVRRNAALRDLLGEHGDVGRAVATLVGDAPLARMRESGGREKIELRPSPTTLEAVVAEALEASRELIDARGHAVEVALPAEPLALYADPTRLAQVVGNLIGNAAKYTPPGGRIVLSGARESGNVVLSVRDTGRGIPAEMLPRIFELFTQGAGAEGGLGVGLALARMLVELHGGTLTAASAGVGRGSEFVVRLPIGAASTVADRTGGPARARLPARRIVLIEDDDDTRDVLRLTLELDGHGVATAADGASGVELALGTSPDVVLIDIGLPTLDGYTVAERIRAALGATVLLVALTGYGAAADRRRAAAAGFDAHLVKPVAYDSLIHLLDTHTPRR